MADTLGPLRPDEEKIYEGQPKGFPLGDYKTYLEDIMLPEGDDLGIPSDDDSIGEDEIETETGFGSVIGELTLMDSGQVAVFRNSLALSKILNGLSIDRFGRMQD